MQLRELLAQGQVNAESLAWYDGLHDWAQLGTILEDMAPAAQAPIAPMPVRGGNVAPTVLATTPSLQKEATPFSGVIQTNVKQGALLGGLVCFLLGLVFMYISLFSFILYGPLFLVALILSIVAMAQGRVAGGVILLLVNLIIPTVFGLFLFSVRASQALASFSPSTPVHADTPITVADTTTPPPMDTATTTAPTATPPTTPTDPSSPTNASPVVMPQTSAVQPPAPKHAALDAKMGFRTYKLGTPFSQFNPDDLDAGTTFEKTDMKPYFVKTFDKQLGAAEIDSIQLDFVQDILQSVRVSVKGKQSALALKDTLIAAYGQPDDTSSIIGEIDTWNGDDCVLTFTTEAVGEGASADFSSKSVNAKIKAITEQKAKSGAAAGVQGL